MNTTLAIIIATKNRAEAIKKYALSSLEKSDFRDFICVVWDASDGLDTRNICEQNNWSFDLQYFKAPRIGSSSQRNDAMESVFSTNLGRYCLFFDDDSELSVDALQGVVESFKGKEVWGVNIPHVSEIGKKNVSSCLMQSKVRWVTPWLHNKGIVAEPHNVQVEWLSGCGMAFRIEVFRDLGLRFPEAFQKFGGYALGEDVALSYYLHKKMKKKMINSVSGTLCHHSYGSARLNIANMAASKWHNFHLLFDAIYDDVSGPKLWWLKIQFKLFMVAAAVKLLIRARSFDVLSVVKGINAARAALKEFHATQDIKQLMRAPGSQEPEVSEK